VGWEGSLWEADRQGRSRILYNLLSLLSSSSSFLNILYQRNMERIDEKPFARKRQLISLTLYRHVTVGNMRPRVTPLFKASHAPISMGRILHREIISAVSEVTEWSNYSVQGNYQRNVIVG